MNSGSGKSLSESVVTSVGLALLRERAGALEGIVAANSDSDSWSGISTSITDSGEVPLEVPPTGLASG